MVGFDMPQRGVALAEGDVRTVVPERPVAVRRRRWRQLVLGVIAIVLGIGFIVYGTVVLKDVTGAIRLGSALPGLALLYYGVSQVGRFAFGESFDLAVWVSAVWLGLLAFVAIFADMLPLAESHDIANTLATPTLLRPDLFSEHPLGTDRQGLDILGELVYGARVSLVVSIGAVAIGMVIGGTIGMVAGYFRGKVDGGVGLLADSMLAFPPLILLLAVAAVLERSVTNVTLALAVLGIPTYIRLARANTLVFAQRDFVLASRVLGAKSRRIISRELLPNVVLPVVSYGFIVVGALIVAEASLSFLGLSIPRPQPTWGNMIAAGQDNFDRDPHLVFIPGVVLFMTVFALNRVGEKVRRRWDPRGSRL